MNTNIRSWMMAKEKETFFKKVNVLFVNRIQSHFESSSGTLKFSLNKPIVDNIIGGLLFQPNNLEGDSLSWVLNLFKENEPKLKASTDKSNLISCKECVVEINTSKRHCNTVVPNNV